MTLESRLLPTASEQLVLFGAASEEGEFLKDTDAMSALHITDEITADIEEDTLHSAEHTA